MQKSTQFFYQSEQALRHHSNKYCDNAVRITSSDVIAPSYVTDDT